MRAPQQLSTPWGHTLSSRYSDSQATVTEEPECDQSQHNDSATSEGSHTVDDSTDSNSDTASGPDEPDLGRSTRPRRGLLMGQVLDKLRPKERVPDGPRAPCAVAHRSSIGVAVNKRPAGIARWVSVTVYARHCFCCTVHALCIRTRSHGQPGHALRTLHYIYTKFAPNVQNCTSTHHHI